jgi:hypothetical protein
VVVYSPISSTPTALGTDLFVPGEAQYTHPFEQIREVVSGKHTVSLAPETISMNTDTTLEFTVHRENQGSYLEPYLGALGHLVVLGEGDLAYLHVHPAETEARSGIVKFATRHPATGRYYLFLQARPDGQLITTAFDVTVTESAEKDSNSR